MYTCPMHLEVIKQKPGSCPICGMRLVLRSSLKKKTAFTTYRPLIVIIGLISLVTVLVSLNDLKTGRFTLTGPMTYFMAGFFIVFSGFKLLDLRGFADGYSTYDLLARKWRAYGYIYPFLELGLGVLYLTQSNLYWVNVATILLMGFSGLGVLESLAKKRGFVCACLGTIIKVPLTTVTLIEDFGMVGMAAMVLFTK
jgi:Heavy metal binding domain